ncbi:MAG: hypothetical protein OEZ01_14115, partial [Candidatus Heimdallarchaeota archaeon]|nr:hypothetical protein [Candidatus Heimdallarchaeota archaeon]
MADRGYLLIGKNTYPFMSLKYQPAWLWLTFYEKKHYQSLIHAGTTWYQAAIAKNIYVKNRLQWILDVTSKYPNIYRYFCFLHTYLNIFENVDDEEDIIIDLSEPNNLSYAGSWLFPGQKENLGLIYVESSNFFNDFFKALENDKINEKHYEWFKGKVNIDLKSFQTEFDFDFKWMWVGDFD